MAEQEEKTTQALPIPFSPPETQQRPKIWSTFFPRPSRSSTLNFRKSLSALALTNELAVADSVPVVVEEVDSALEVAEEVVVVVVMAAAEDVVAAVGRRH